MREQQWSDPTGAFMDAATGQCSWYDALGRLADATGSRHAQFVGLGPRARHEFNFLTNADEGLGAAFAATPGHDPAWNPRVRAGLGRPLLCSFTEADFTDREAMRRDPHYTDFAFPCDIPFSSLAPPERGYAEPGTFAGLGVFRGMCEGPIEPQQRAVFDAVAPSVRAALRTQLALEDQAGALLTGVLESVGVPALLLDRCGRVKAVSGAADDLITDSGAISLSSGRLYATRPDDARILDRAVLAALDPDPRRRVLLQTVVLRSPARRKRTSPCSSATAPCRKPRPHVAASPSARCARRSRHCWQSSGSTGRSSWSRGCAHIPSESVLKVPATRRSFIPNG